MTTPLRVLILEDRLADAELSVHELRRAGFEPAWRRVGTEADYLAHLDPGLDLILADYHLPGFDASHALQLLRARGLDIPFIVISGAISEEVAVECMKQGAADYLLKDRLARLGSVATQALEAKRLREARWRAEEIARGLAEVSRELVETLDVAQATDRVVSTVLRLFGFRLATVFEVDPDSGDLVCVAAAGADDPRGWIGQILPAGAGVAGRAVLERCLVWSADLGTDPRITFPDWARERLRDHGYRSAVGVPLVARGETLGALSLAHTGTISEEELRLLPAFADQAALAIANARLHEETQRRLRETETLLTVSQSIATTLDPAEMLRRVAQAVGRALGADMVGAYLADPDGSVLRPLAGYHVPEHLLEAFRRFPIPLQGHRLVEEAFESLRPMFSSDTGADTRLDRETFGRFPHRSILFVPMLGQAKPIGGLFAVWWDQAHGFAPDELRLADAIGRQAALAMENARLFAEAERRQREGEGLARIARVLTESLDVSTVAERIVNSVLSLLGAQSAGFRLQRPDGSLEAIAADASGAHAAPGDALTPGMGISGRVVADGVPLWCRDLVSDPRFSLDDEIRRRLTATGIRAFLGVPLRVKGQIMGALTVGAETGREFSESEIALLQAVADQAALALENARHYEETERRRREAEVVAGLARRINEALDLDAVLQRVVEAAMELCGADAAQIALREGESETVVFRYWSGSPYQRYGTLRIEPGRGLGGLVLATGRPARTADYAADPRVGKQYLEVIREDRIVAELAVPIRSEGRVEGLLYVDNHTARPFSDHDEGILLQLADHAATAIGKAQLLDDLKTRQARLEALLEANRELSRIQPLPSLLERIAEACGRLLSADSARFRLREGDELLVTAQWGDPEKALPTTPIRIGEGAPGAIAATGEPIVMSDITRDPRILPAVREAARRLGCRAWLGVPVKIGERVLGVLSAVTCGERGFSAKDVEVATALASQAATALENARLYQETARAYEELSQSQAQLIQVQKMEAIGRLAGGVAHDFNNLLTVILGRSRILLDRMESGAPDRRHVTLIQQTAERAGTLTHQLLAFSRKQVLQPRVLDLNTVVASMEKMLRRLIGEDIELVTEPGANLELVEADAAQLEQVLLNLAVNARDAMPQGGRLTIETANRELDHGFVRHHMGARPGRYVELAVGDTGCGMDTETQARVFEPFFTTKGPGKGTGLGLATVYGIVKQHQGYVLVESEPGRGATFRIYLPCAESPVELDESGALPEAAPGGSETILLVEDDAGLRELVREVLQTSGYVVLEARDAAEALALCEQHPGAVDLVLTDVIMPQMSGRELAERLTSRRPGLRVLYMSGYTDDALGRHGVLDPGVALLQKPFSPDALARRVREVLEGRA